MTMEFAPASVPSTGSSYTDKDRPRDEPAKLHLFRFGTARELFAPMQYNDKDETVVGSPTESGPHGPRECNSRDGQGADGVAPSNQLTHELQETSDSSACRREHEHVYKPMGSAHGSRRKNSLEMFLSQSPSQALGGDFLKLSLDDRQASRQPNELLARTTSNASAGARATRSGHGYERGHFELNSVADDAMRGRYRPPAHAPPSTNRDSGPQVPSSLSRGSSVSTPSPVVYHGTYLMQHPPLEESWATHETGPRAMYHDHVHEYYSHPPSYLPEPLYQPEWYRAPPGNPAYGYSHPSSRVQVVAGHWNPVLGTPSPPPRLYEHGTRLFPPSRANGMRGPSMEYMAPSHGMQHPLARTHGRNLYARMPPPLPENSPPHSPRKGLGLKPCKFFVQGHCRMGTKCKFVHHASADAASHAPGRTPLYPQRMVLSPLPMMHTHGPPGDESTFPGRAHARLAFRTDASSGNGLTGTLVPTPPSRVGSCPTDLSTMSTALSVADIQNRVVAMSKDQNGCRLLQEQLDYDERTDLWDVIYHEALDHLADMMVDPFGNYLFQKLLERVEDKQRVVIIRRVSAHLVAAALNLHGTRSVQKVVEVCATCPTVVTPASDAPTEFEYHQEPAITRRPSTRLPDLIVDALQDDAVRLCIDSNGNHVIQRALQFLAPEDNQFVFDAVCQECTTVGTHRHGCCVLQRCLDAANKGQKTAVIAQVERHAMKLMQDPYGNYVVQYVLDSCTAEEALGVMVKPLGHLFDLSIQKFSSNVIEKCLEKAPERVRQQYLAELTTCSKLNRMLQDQFANYVVQRALCVCAEDQCLLLVQAIRPHLAAMKNTSGGRRITARILKRFPSMDIGLDSGVSSPRECFFEPALMMRPLPGAYLPGPAGFGYGRPEPLPYPGREPETDERRLEEEFDGSSRA